MRRSLATLLVIGSVTTAVAQETSRPNGHTDRDSTFKQVDENGDGRINAEESAAIEGFDFAQADTNEDRMLTRQEFAAAMATLASRDEAKESSSAASGSDSVTFREADKNSDGKIDFDEAAAIDGFDFFAADADHDLEVSRAEFRAALAELRSRGPLTSAARASGS
jgi:Ca2+-binding EF-hand superfamily protein